MSSQDIPIQFFNVLYSQKLDLSSEDIWASSHIVAEIYRLTTLSDPTTAIDGMFKVIRSHPAFADFTRASLVGRVGESNQFRCLTNNSPAGEGGGLTKGHTCFVAHDSSLFQLKSGSARLMRDLKAVINSYAARSLEPQKILKHLRNQGYTTSLALPVLLSDSLRGVLFLNSTKELNVQSTVGGALYLLSLLQVWCTQFFLIYYPPQRCFWAASTLPSLSTEFTEESFRHYFETAASELLHRKVRLSIVNGAEQRFLYVPCYVIGALVHMLRVAAPVLRDDKVGIAISLEDHRVAITFDTITHGAIRESLTDSLAKRFFVELCESVVDYGLHPIDFADAQGAGIAMQYERSSPSGMCQYSIM